MAETGDVARPVTLDAIARRLDRIFVRLSTNDRLLDTMAWTGRIGPGVGLALIVDGVLMIGAIGAADLFADAVVDATSDAWAAFAVDEKVRSEVLEAVRLVESRIAERAKADGEWAEQTYPLEAELDDIAVEDVVRLLEVIKDRTVLDLHDVQVHYPGRMEPISVSNVRVRLDRVSAWWPLKAQGVNVNYIYKPIDKPD